MRFLKRRPRARQADLGELDPFLLAMVARLAEARMQTESGDAEWVRMDHVAALSRKMTEALNAALHTGWDEEAERRDLVERREGPDGIEIRLTDRGRDVMSPLLG
jgi:hypothetical protein